MTCHRLIIYFECCVVIYDFIELVDTNDRVCKGSTNVATSRPDRLAQWIARQTSNLKVAGSSPALVRPIFWLFHGRLLCR